MLVCITGQRFTFLYKKIDRYVLRTRLYSVLSGQLN